MPGWWPAVFVWLEDPGAIAPDGIPVARPVASPLAAAFRLVEAGAGEEDLAAALGSEPKALILTGCRVADDVGRIANRIAVVEALTGRPRGRTRIALALGTPAALLAPADLAAASPRIAAVGLDLPALLSAFAPAPAQPVLTHALAVTALAARAAARPAFLRLTSGYDRAKASEAGYPSIAIGGPFGSSVCRRASDQED